jgi:hypothetical protein
LSSTVRFKPNTSNENNPSEPEGNKNS